MLSVPVPGGGSGKWYRKVPMANDLLGRVQTKSKKMSGRKKSDEEISVMDCVFHHPCGCNICRKCDRLKEEFKNKVKKENVVVESEMSIPSLPVPDVPSPTVGFTKPKVRQDNRKRNVKTMKPPKSFESFNRFGLLFSCLCSKVTLPLSHSFTLSFTHS